MKRLQEIELTSAAIGGGWGINPFSHPVLLDKAPSGDGTGGNPGGAAAPATSTAPAAGGEATGDGDGGDGTGTQRQSVTPELQQQYGPLLDAIDGRLEAGLVPVREQNAELRGRLDQLSQPIHNAQSLFGGGRAPYVTSGPLLGSEEDRRG